MPSSPTSTASTGIIVVPVNRSALYRLAMAWDASHGAPVAEAGLLLPADPATPMRRTMAVPRAPGGASATVGTLCRDPRGE